MANLIVEISKLSIVERIQLVQEILATISSDAQKEENLQLPEDAINEIEKRSASIKNGTAKTVLWDTIQETLTKRYDL